MAALKLTYDLLIQQFDIQCTACVETFIRCELAIAALIEITNLLECTCISKTKLNICNY